MNDMLGHLDRLWDGLLVTVELTVLSFAGGLVLGTVLAIMRIVPVRPLQIVATAYVSLVRNIPLLVLLVLFVFGLPEIGIIYSLFATVVTAMALYAAAYIADIVRSGILTVPAGEAQAARALGLRTGQALRYVILPQAFRSMVQPIANIFIAVALNSSLAAAVGVVELTGQTDLLNLEYADAGTTFLFSTAFYLLLTLSIGLACGRLERRMAIKR